MENKENFNELSRNGATSESINVSSTHNENRKRSLQSPTNIVNDGLPSSKISKMDLPNTSSSAANDGFLPKNNDVEIPTNIEEVRKFLENPDRLKQFEAKVIEKVKFLCGEFHIYTVNVEHDVVSYLAFHHNKIVSQLSNRNDCKIFVYNCEELLGQFQRFTVPFQGIQNVLMIFVNHKIDRITPLGVFLLPNKSTAIITDVIGKVNQWLNGATVTKCIATYDFHESVGKIWPTAMLIGCSDEYQKEVKLYAKRNKGQTNEGNKDLTRLACMLCYVPQMYIPTGIEVVVKRIGSEYGSNLIDYLRTNWIGIKSVFGEVIVYRSVKVCKEFSKRMIDNYFESKSRYSLPKDPVNNIIDFMNFLLVFSKIQLVEMGLDDSTLERRRLRRFEMNTELQKENEAKILRSFDRLNLSIELASNDEKAIKRAVEQFMFSIY